MTRMTRAKAAEVAETIHIDADETSDLTADNAGSGVKLQAPEITSPRKPLGELALNSTDGAMQSEEATDELKKSTRGRKAGKKGGASSAKNSKTNTTPEPPQTAQIVEEQTEPLFEKGESAPSAASEETVNELSKDIAQLDISQERSTRSKTPPTAAARLTRSQIAKSQDIEVVAEPKSLIDGIGQTAEEQREEVQEVDTGLATAAQPTILADDDFDTGNTMEKTALDAPASPLPSAMPNIVMSLRKDSPVKRSTSNKENVEPEETNMMDATDSPATPRSPYDQLEHAAVESASPPRQTAERPASRPEDQITAMDDLSDAIESTKNDIPDVPEVPTSPEKPSKKGLSEKAEGPSKKKAAPVVRTTKAAQGRLSIVQGGARAPSLGKPRPSMTLGRSNSVRVTGKTDPAPKKPSTTKGNDSSKLTAEKKEVVIPHSKPRPISMSFPIPPPVAKSTRAPTQSTFKLPGEAIAEKLKAQREARQAKEAAEELNKKPFKARPVPSSLKVAPTVRSTNASKARESAIGASTTTTKDFRASVAGGPVHKRANSVTTAASTNMRASTAGVRPRLASNTSNSSTFSKPGSMTSRPASMALANRPSTAMADLSNSRPPPSSSSSAAGAAPAATSGKTGTAKGKEVFNRAAVAKETAEREKREKEAAAKQARVAAAERGRAASREWAEKQRLRKLGLKGDGVTQAGKAAEEVAVVEADEVAVEVVGGL